MTHPDGSGGAADFEHLLDHADQFSLTGLRLIAGGPIVDSQPNKLSAETLLRLKLALNGFDGVSSASSENWHNDMPALATATATATSPARIGRPAIRKPARSSILVCSTIVLLLTCVIAAIRPTESKQVFSAVKAAIVNIARILPTKPQGANIVDQPQEAHAKSDLRYLSIDNFTYGTYATSSDGPVTQAGIAHFPFLSVAKVLYLQASNANLALPDSKNRMPAFNSGGRIVATYDSVGALMALTAISSADAPETFSYDSAMQLASVKPGEMGRQYKFDATSRMVSLQSSEGVNVSHLFLSACTDGPRDLASLPEASKEWARSFSDGLLFAAEIPVTNKSLAGTWSTPPRASDVRARNWVTRVTTAIVPNRPETD